jgi:hypothetical protein
MKITKDMVGKWVKGINWANDLQPIRITAVGEERFLARAGSIETDYLCAHDWILFDEPKQPGKWARGWYLVDEENLKGYGGWFLTEVVSEEIFLNHCFAKKKIWPAVMNPDGSYTAPEE